MYIFMFANIKHTHMYQSMANLSSCCHCNSGMLYIICYMPSFAMQSGKQVCSV